MAKRETAKIANSDLLNGEKYYLEKAREVLPYLVRQAKAGQTIYYSSLAEAVNMPNPRNLNYVLGAIGNALIELGKHTHEDIPPLQLVVINKRENLPGEGIGWFISRTDFNKLTKPQKRKVVDAQLTNIYTYPYWDWVLEELGLKPIETNLEGELQKAKGFKGGGESEHHKKFKEYISKNPSVIGLSPTIANGKVEYALPSADTIDVLFSDNGLKIGVEVKSAISDMSDILRGLFQCVKYKSLIEAEQTIKDELPNSKVILALQGELPSELLIAKNLLGIEVVDRIETSR